MQSRFLWDSHLEKREYWDSPCYMYIVDTHYRVISAHVPVRYYHKYRNRFNVEVVFVLSFCPCALKNYGEVFFSTETKNPSKTHQTLRNLQWQWRQKPPKPSRLQTIRIHNWVRPLQWTHQTQNNEQQPWPWIQIWTRWKQIATMW